MARNVIEELRRIEGVGRVQLFGAEQAMRTILSRIFRLHRAVLAMNQRQRRRKLQSH